MKSTYGFGAMAGPVTAAVESMEVDPPATQLPCVEHYYARAPISAVIAVLLKVQVPSSVFIVQPSG